jgi:hypothetical protein
LRKAHYSFTIRSGQRRDVVDQLVKEHLIEHVKLVRVRMANYLKILVPLA